MLYADPTIMSATNSPRPQMLTPSRNSSTSRSTAMALNKPKLRNSCDACATSKLKCWGEKPSCSRCVKRRITCEYVFAKRGGRKPNRLSHHLNTEHSAIASNKAASMMGESAQTSWQADWLTLSSTSTSALPSPALTDCAAERTSSNRSDMFSGFPGFMTQPLAPMSLDDDGSLEDLFMSPMSFSLPDACDNVTMLDSQSLFVPAMETGGMSHYSFSESLLGPEDGIADLLAFSNGNRVPQNATPIASEPYDMYQQSFRAVDSSCCCLIQALGLMKELTTLPANVCVNLALQGSNETVPVAATETIIAQNKSTVEAISRMLDCSCSHDRYLLTIMSLVIFKVLDRYSTAAQSSPSLQASRTRHSSQPSGQELRASQSFTSDSCFDDEDSPRLATQLVLSELHCVRHIVEQMSSKLKEQKGKADRKSSESLDFDDNFMSPFSTTMYDQLETDLRQRLRNVSTEMIDRLRRV